MTIYFLPQFKPTFLCTHTNLRPLIPTTNKNNQFSIQQTSNHATNFISLPFFTIAHLFCHIPPLTLSCTRNVLHYPTVSFNRDRETLELITKGGHASLRPFRFLPLFAKNFTKEYFENF